jgi:hypothetical protein
MVHTGLTKKQAHGIVHSLTQTGPMPCPSYDLPKSACRTGSKLAQDPCSVCFGCYGNEGMQAFRNSIQAQEKRLRTLQNPQWVNAFITLTQTMPFFRWHSLGDIQSFQHLQNIAHVAQKSPSCSYWLPTKEKQTVWAFIRKHKRFPSNLLVRVSTFKRNSKPFKTNEQVLTSVVVDPSKYMQWKKRYPDTFLCPKGVTQTACNECRACWDRTIACIVYIFHNHSKHNKRERRELALKLSLELHGAHYGND